MQSPIRYSVSVKGVVVYAEKVLLLLNDRDEWELPSGRLESDEQPPECAVREIWEETGWRVGVRRLLDSWVYRIASGPGILIVTYGCDVVAWAEPVVSSEHRRVALFAEDEVAGLTMPEGYKRSVAAWFRSGAAS